MSSSNQRPANRGFRPVLRCAISHYRQSPLTVCTRTPPVKSTQMGVTRLLCDALSGDCILHSSIRLTHSSSSGIA